MEVESKPEAIESLDRRIIQMKIEESALGKESDAASKERLATLQSELANLEQQSAELTQKWQAEKDKIHAETTIKVEHTTARPTILLLSYDEHGRTKETYYSRQDPT